MIQPVIASPVSRRRCGSADRILMELNNGSAHGPVCTSVIKPPEHLIDYIAFVTMQYNVEYNCWNLHGCGIFIAVLSFVLQLSISVYENSCILNQHIWCRT